jgi:hypothetical protein
MSKQLNRHHYGMSSSRRLRHSTKKLTVHGVRVQTGRHCPAFDFGHKQFVTAASNHIAVVASAG